MLRTKTNMAAKVLLLAAVLLTAMSGYLLFGNDVEESYAVWVVFSLALYSFGKCTKHAFRLPVILLSLYIPLVFLGGQIYWENKVFFPWQMVCVLLGGTVGSYCLLNKFENLCREKTLASDRAFGLPVPCYMVLLLLGWLPTFLSDYPGLLLSDSVWQWNMALGNSRLSNHHPVSHTFLIYIAQKITAIFGGGTVQPTVAVAVYSVLQLILLALILAFAIKIIDKTLQNRWVTVAVLACFALYPLQGILGINMTKDTLFSAFVLLLGVLTWRICCTDGAWLQQTRNKVILCVGLILVLLFRSNGFLVSLGTVAALFVFYHKKYWKQIAVCGAILVVFWAAWGKALDVAGVVQPSISESLGMPLNQIGNIVSKDRPLTEEEKDLIEQVIPLDTLKETYSPWYSDPIKWSDAYDPDAIVQNKGAYLKLWLSLVAKYPLDCLEASLKLTVGFWYPGVTKGSISFDLPQKITLLEDIGAENKPIISGTLMDPFIGTEIRENTWFSWLFSIGNVLILCWTMLAFTIQKAGGKYLCIGAPVLLTWLSLLLATPSYCETRYIYSAFLSLPLFVCVYLGCQKKETQKGV